MTHPSAKANDVTAVTVEYTRDGRRATKEFKGKSCVGASRRFYREKMTAGADPKIVGAARGLGQ